MKSYIFKICVLVALLFFGINTKTFSQTLMEKGQLNTKIDSNQMLFQTVVVEKKDSLNLSETGDTLPIEKKFNNTVVRLPTRCMQRIESAPVSIYLIDPCSTIQRYRSKDILRYRL